MARRAETLDDLFDAKAVTETWEEFSARAGIASRTVWRLRRGMTKGAPHRGTIAMLAQALGVDPARVRAAIEASRAAADGD